jgi:colicin import membrane protein
MKKIIIAIALMFGSAGFIYAQNTTPDATTKKQKKEKTTSVQTTSTQSTGLKKDGTPDMRLKANKTKAPTTTTTTVAPTTTPVTKAQTTTTVQPKATPVQQVQPKVQTQVAKTTSVKTADAAIGTDAKGRTLYQGPKGGKYYINKNGNKEYVK